MHAPTPLATFVRAIRDGRHADVRSLAAADPTLVRALDPDCFHAPSIIRAAETDDPAMVDLLLELGADINQKSGWWAGGFGVLDSGSEAMAAHLLKRGATLTPHAAARLGRIDDLRRMLDADPSLVHARGGDGQLPLHFARTPAIADLLLDRGASIDALDLDHASTAAQWLCETRPEVAAHLVSRGAAPDPILAARIGDLPLLERLLRAEAGGVNFRITRERFPAPPPAAGHIYLYTVGDGCGLVHAASDSGRADLIRWLAARGADVNARGGYDNATPLHASAWRDRPDSAAALLDAGADINARSGALHNNEPIGWAIVAGSAAMVRLLLDRGAALRPMHAEDARMGAEGAFRQFKAGRPIDAWREIARLLAPR